MHYRFGDCMLDPHLRELTRGSEAVAVGPRVFDLLVYLIRNRDKIVSRASLLESVWTGRAVSRSTVASYVNAARKAIGDSGEGQHLIKTFVRQGFRFVGVVEEIGRPDLANSPKFIANDPGLQASASLSLPDKPSIAILAFQNLSESSTQDYFADGIVEDIITALSRIRWLFVIARDSSFTYRERTIDAKQIGRELGVRYVLQGSIRKVTKRVRITGELVDAITGENLWAERFEGTLKDIFELQDRIAMHVAGAIAPQLERAEIARVRSKPTESLSAYECYLRGKALLNQGTKAAVGDALTLFEQAIHRDPEFASAHGMAAWCYFWRKVNGWAVDRQQEMIEGERLARRAIELGRDDAVALTRSGHALFHFVGDLDGGLALVDRALELDPNLAAAWFIGGYLRVWRGEPDSAIEYFQQAMRLSPRDPEMYRMQAGIAAAHLFAGRYNCASTWAAKSYSELPSFLMVVSIIAASYALAGRKDDAEKAINRLRELDPTLRISGLKDWILIRRPEDQATLAEGLRMAGLPE